ncbi:MAG: MFS transporter [Candidatus Bipolaricaulota bacterium]|nr:MFS transporter [Candidatus Bipolaricaulota bacterium]
MKRAFISLFIAVSVAMLGVGIIAPILPLYAKTFSATGVSIGLVFAAFSLSRSLLGPILGRFSDRIGRKRMLVIGLAGYAGISILYAIAASLWQLGLFRLLQGAASVMVTPIAQAYIGDITPPGKEGRYMNGFYSAMFLGMALGPLLGGSLSAAFSYQAAFYGMGGLSTIALLLVARTVPTDHVHREERRSKSDEIVPLRDVMRNDGVKAICVYVATRGFWRQGFNTFYPLFATASAGLGEASIGLVLSVYMLGGGLLQIPFGFLADRLPRFPQIILGSVGAPLLLLAVPFVHRMHGIVTIMFAIGALSALSRASILAFRTELGRTHGMGTLAGLQGSAFAAGQMIGPPTSGLIADTLGLSAVFPFGSAVGLLGSGFVLMWFRSWRRSGFPGATKAE